jgi:uncharacterized protein (TIGR02147 family)
MTNIYEYLDYQQFLQEYIESKKKETPWFSFRFLALKLNMDHSNLVKIVLKKRHASRKNAIDVAKFLKFNAKETEYFITLVEFNKAKNQAKSRQLLEKLIAIKNINLTKIEPHQYDYYRQWYNTVIYTLLDFYEFRGDFAALAASVNPPITVKQAKESIELLENLQLIRREDDGRYVQTKKMITTGQSWHSVAIQTFQEEMMKRAMNSLLTHPRGVRDISTLTMSLSQSDMEAIREATLQYRASVIKIINESEKSDSVYQLNVQFFPMTKPKWNLT